MSQNITIQGASYSAVPAVTLPKTGGGTATFTDVTDTTATAADVSNTKYFYTAAGVRTQGTSSGGGGGGGSVTQDENGFIVLPATGGGGGDVEFESGTVTVATATNNIDVTFTDAHTEPPTIVVVSLYNQNGYDSTNYTIYGYCFVRYSDINEFPFYGGSGDTSPVYGVIYRVQRSNNAGSLNFGSQSVTSQPDAITSTGFSAAAASTSYYFRPNTYKWYAYWL